MGLIAQPHLRYFQISMSYSVHAGIYSPGCNRNTRLDNCVILVRQCNDLARSLDCLEELEGSLYDSCLHLNIVRCTSVSAHRYHRSSSSRCTSLSYNWWKCCDNNCRDTCSLDCSLHDCCRAVAGSSSSGKETSVNALILKHLSYSRTCLVGELLNVSAAAHESCMVWCASLDVL